MTGIDTGADIEVFSDTTGSIIAIAGWQDNSLATESRVPVMWRFGHEEDLVAMDSLRGPATTNQDSLLVFTSDESISNVVIGWRNESVDAALWSYAFDTNSRQWLPALQLPEALPTLDKQPFAATVTLSADGNTLMIASEPNATGSVDNSNSPVTGQIRVFR